MELHNPRGIGTTFLRVRRTINPDQATYTRLSIFRDVDTGAASDLDGHFKRLDIPCIWQCHHGGGEYIAPLDDKPTPWIGIDLGQTCRVGELPEST